MDYAKKGYGELRKPSFAPPPWVFGPVWSVLYILIFCSFGYVLYEWHRGVVPGAVVVLFVCNLLTNFAYSPIQFRLRSLVLASFDILLVLLSLIMAMTAIYPYYRWVAWVNVPYLLWVCFATILQLSITALNRDRWSSY